MGLKYEILVAYLLLGLISFQCHAIRCIAHTIPQLTAPPSATGLVVGVNQYSHDASCCIIDSSNGKILFSQAKERVTGTKHEGGAVSTIVKYGLESLGATLKDVKLVVSNNHHFRVNPFERNIGWNKALYYCPDSYADEYNIFPNTWKIELSHHLAHAWAAAGTAPFDEGLVLVMDGMGESYKAMVEDLSGAQPDSGNYMHDLKIPKSEKFRCVTHPNEAALRNGSTYREAETAYEFDRATGLLQPLFKRWTRERSPSELYNHGFENMESIGAVYSRISAYINGDWNSCGKVMGLAPWAGRTAREARNGWYFPDASKEKEGPLRMSRLLEVPITSFIKGDPFDGSFVVDWDALDHPLWTPNDWSPRRFGELAAIAQRMQSDLEDCSTALCKSLRWATKAKRLALTGGVALNSVMNSKIRKECGFSEVYVPSAPGDEGIALGCALYGLQRLRLDRAQDLTKPREQRLMSWTAMHPSLPSKQHRFPAYQGREFINDDIVDALADMERWVDVQSFATEEEMLADAVTRLDEGKVLAWFQGRSEFGQRALGARSILADPRDLSMRRVINERVKQREWYRPLAPSVLDEHVGEWFEDLQSGENASPYMSLTAKVRPEQVRRVPAICHVDNTARLQTVTVVDNSLYHRLITLFHRRTGIPMVLNTSFNRKGQPIVETPAQAIATLVSGGGGGDIAHMYMGRHRVTVKPFPLASGALKDKQNEVTVTAAEVYLAESCTNGAGLAVGAPRVQMADANGEVAWRTLPSPLHLAVLQVIKQGPEDGGAYPVRQLLGVVQRRPELSAQDRKVKEVEEALRWLYLQQLVSFEV